MFFYHCYFNDIRFGPNRDLLHGWYDSVILDDFQYQSFSDRWLYFSECGTSGLPSSLCSTDLLVRDVYARSTNFIRVTT